MSCIQLSTVGDRALSVATARVWKSAWSCFFCTFRSYLPIPAQNPPVLYSLTFLTLPPCDCTVTAQWRLVTFGHFNRSCLLTYLWQCECRLANVECLSVFLHCSIFSYLDIVSLCLCGGVCKYWHQMARDGSIWQHVHFLHARRLPFQVTVSNSTLSFHLSCICKVFVLRLWLLH